MLVTGIRIIEQDVIRSSGLKIPPCQSGVGIHLLVEQRHVQRDEFPVFPVRIDRHRDRRLLRSGVERRGSLDRQRRLAKHGRPARRSVDHRLGDVVLHDLEGPGLPRRKVSLSEAVTVSPKSSKTGSVSFSPSSSSTAKSPVVAS